MSTKRSAVLKDGKLYVSTATAVDLYDASRSTIIRDMNQGKLPFHTKPNGFRLPLKQALDHLYERRLPDSMAEFTTAVAGASRLTAGNSPLTTEQLAQIGSHVVRAHAILSSSNQEVA